MRTCEKCGGDGLVALRSINILHCADCNHRQPWKLKEGQKPLLGSSRQKNGGDGNDTK